MNARPPGSTQPLAIVSLASSLLAYASSFVGSPALIWPALGVALVAIACGHLARRAIRAEPGTGGGAIAMAGLVSGYAYLVLGGTLIALMRGAGTA